MLVFSPYSDWLSPSAHFRVWWCFFRNPNLQKWTFSFLISAKKARVVSENARKSQTICFFQGKKLGFSPRTTPASASPMPPAPHCRSHSTQLLQRTQTQAQFTRKQRSLWQHILKVHTQVVRKFCGFAFWSGVASLQQRESVWQKLAHKIVQIQQKSVREPTWSNIWPPVLTNWLFSEPKSSCSLAKILCFMWCERKRLSWPLGCSCRLVLMVVLSKFV